MTSILAFGATSQQVAGENVKPPSRSQRVKQARSRIVQQIRANILYSTSPTAPTRAQVEREALPIFVRLLQSMSSEVR